MEHCLSVSGLAKSYEKFRLRDISFDLPQGFIMGLVGNNGSGKTTIIKMILKLIRQDEGEIRYFGLPADTQFTAVLQRMGFVQDVPTLYGHLNLHQMKEAVAGFYRKWNEGRFLELSSHFGLPLTKKVNSLSRGMTMKYSICLALSHDPELLILDEPSAGLDPVARRDLLDLLSDCIQDGCSSVLFSTHLMSDLERTADYVTCIHDGRLICADTKDGLLERWGLVKGGEELLTPETRRIFTGLRLGEYGFEGLTERIDLARDMFGAAVVIDNPTLEDIMIHLGKGGADD
ncbi:MAG: ABC transporter ATP-binding protein [bacterium]|nr:ABC transporter ATP-binding protein [bacterium]